MSQTTTDADVIIIGSGVMGGLLATRLLQAGKSVIIVEAGPRVTRQEIVERFRNSPFKMSLTNMKLQGVGSPYPDLPYVPSTYGDYLQQVGPVKYPTKYLRVVGGTTWHFGSALWRMIPNDFRLQSLYGHGRDWPLSYDDLEPWYCDAEYELGVSGVDGQDESGHGGKAWPPRSKPFPMPGLPTSYMFDRLSELLGKGGYNPVLEPNGRATRPWGNRPVCAGNNNCNPVCPIGAKYDGTRHIDEAERLGAKLLDNSVVYNIEADDSGKITRIWYRKPDRSEHSLTANVFIVAAYGIESPKLLLMSVSEKYPKGIANSSDQVGRNLMGHTGISMNFMMDEDVWPGQGPTELLVYLNNRDGEFRKQFPSYKIKVRNTVPTADYAASLISKGILGSELDAELRRQSARSLNFAIDFETVPLPENRIVPSKTKTDAIGIPLPELSYSVTDYWQAGKNEGLKDFANFAKLLGGKILKIDTSYQDRQHIMGTTIMGDDPKNSVVNSDCRTHDHPNLYIAGTSVMPSTSCMNPTLTGAALTLRLADHLLKNNLV
ncbi:MULTISPECIES: GMC family oxidoreductase [Tatumella]|uniref:Membrane-bound 2-keto-D-gluconate dehydrogenase, flavoprotein subunit n=2 Tax=Tatumella ptyseos TaxID=82987 RepID=A0A085JPG3_9GAMM|nr:MULTISPECIES: GMC family oxidoreductase [Tatumella]KFD22359.1 membrane-bound 2-keto-D-gluconate dehydrogenase, flavoprotein subunit [Tatumella ptyseos ATCC 33301]SQK77473.1 Gluconate 2-dehydrogenase flavoprotein precursor [Tatumella ptyseos]